jgi:hypothetical protein
MKIQILKVIIIAIFIFLIKINSNGKNIIVSLTSYPPRIKYVYITIKSLIKQTLKPNLIILWLAESEFPNKNNDLPRNLLSLRKERIKIEYYEQNIKSYKKLIPTLEKYPNKLIITVDDDIIYSSDTIEKLYNNYLKYPKDIQAHRITKFIYNSGIFQAIAGGYDYYNSSSFLNKVTGVGGVLYPPNCFYKDILNKDLFMKLAPTNDDQWFWIQGILNNVKVRVVDNPNLKLNYINNTQKIALSNQNITIFWKDFNRIIDYYPRVKKILINEYNIYINERNSNIFI